MKIGDYCRTKDGFIAKLIEKNDRYKFDGVILEEEYTYNYLSKEHAEELIIKISPNIIDLIEVGDYVNGMKIIDTSSQHYKLVTNLIDNNFREGLKNVYINNEKDIKSIVTKEQFESMEYRIGE